MRIIIRNIFPEFLHREYYERHTEHFYINVIMGQHTKYDNAYHNMIN